MRILCQWNKFLEDQLDFEFGEKGVWFKGKKDGKVVKFGYGLERVE
jgi:hypothetical protein